MKTARTLFVCIAFALALPGTLRAQTAGPTHRAVPQVMAVARIVAINGPVVTIQNGTGMKRTLELTSTQGLRIGQQTSWCEEDCRTLNIVTEYQVRRSTPATR